MMPSPQEVTQLLVAWSDGDPAARDKLVSLVHQELHRLAHAYMRGERKGHTLQTTALVNEAYMKLADWKNLRWQSRAHFFGISAKQMRQIRVDYARKRRSEKRGGKVSHVEINDKMPASMKRVEDFIALDEALKKLALVDARQSQVVELRYFGGLRTKETAEVLKVSSRTVELDWKVARAWLRRELGGGSSHES